MARKAESASAESVSPDMTPLIDVCFLLITFFVMLMTIAKDEAAQRIKLPLAPSAEVLEDDKIPDSLNMNVAYVDPSDPYNGNSNNRRPTLLQWGLVLDVSTPNSQGWATLEQKMRVESALQKQRQGPNWKQEGLTTTIIFRVDKEIDYWIFRRIMDICRSNNFTKFQLKASEEEA